MKGLRIGLILAAIIGVFLGGFSWSDLSRGRLPSPSAFARLTQRQSAESVGAGDIFRDSFRHILATYDGELSPASLKFSAMSGLMESLGDPHTQFLEPRIAEQFSLETRGDFVGVGARLSPDPLGAKVVTVFRTGPAMKAGLKAGDVIVSVDGKKVAEVPLQDIVDRIRGEAGTLVTLGVLRTGRSAPLSMPIKRARVVVPTIDERILDGTKFGYVEIGGFSEQTVEQFAAALRNLARQGMKGLVLDVRGNPGGRLDVAVEMLSELLPPYKVVVTIRYRGNQAEQARTSARPSARIDVPIVVLMDENSASASEIFAGVLQEYKVATVVGEHSFGKASVQQVFETGDGASAKITVAKYLLPSGRDLSRRVDEYDQYVSGGLKADVQVQAAFDSVPGDLKTDNQLRKALDLLRSKLTE